MIGAEASVQGRSAIHTGGVAPCKLRVGDLDSRSHRLHLLHILGGEHCATVRCLHGKFHQMRCRWRLWPDTCWNWVWDYKVLLPQDGRDETGQARCWMSIDTYGWIDAKKSDGEETGARRVLNIGVQFAV